MSRQIKKIIPYILITIALVGLFSSGGKVRATHIPITQYTSYQECIDDGRAMEACGDLPGDRTPTPDAPGTTTLAEPSMRAFEREVGRNNCGFGLWWGSGTPEGCILQFFYWTFYTLGSFLLWIAAIFFNFLISYTLDSQLLRSSFVSHAWGVTRDLSNMFFILVLLYIAIKVILNLGGHDVKKMIASVIVMALLINFSMFFTSIVIDSSNILALIFYNKTKSVDKAGVEVIDQITKKKDLAGGLTQSFNPSYHLEKTFFDNVGNITANGVPTTDKVSIGMLIGITFVSGAIMLFAAYALFISGLSFLGRLIELFVLIIFAPFAFMSFSIPLLSHAEYLGWDAWSKRLIKVAFMAPIFMFFLYFIFLLLGAKMFEGVIQSTDTMVQLLNLIIPALVVLTLLLKAASFAKKGAGHFGELAVKGGQIAAGLVGGVALGGTALALRAGVGGGGGYVANKLASGANKLGLNKMASGLTSVGAFAQKSSFDVRGVKIGGKTLAGATGLSLGEAQKGGIEQRRKEKVEKRMKRAEGLKVREDEKLKQELNKAEADLQGLLNGVAKDFERIDRELESARKKKRDYRSGTAEYIAATDKITALRAEKKDIATGVTGVVVKGVAGVGNAGKTIDQMEQEIIPERKVELQAESRRRTVAFANRTARFGRFSSTANKAAKHKIIMESKIENKGTPQ